MDNLMYCLNATLPIFAVILLGYLLQRRHFFPEGFTAGADKLIFKVLLPVLLFRDIAAGEITASFQLDFFLFCAISTTIYFFVIWFFAAHLLPDKNMVGAFTQGSFRGSLAVLGVAFIQNIYGDAGLAPLMIIATVPLFNIYSVLVLTVTAAQKNQQSLRHIIVHTIGGILGNPIILGILVGLPFSLLHISFPPMIDKTVDLLARSATPLALISIGAGFEGKKALTKLRPTFAATAIKLIVLPAVFLPAAYALGFRDQALVALLIMLGAPSTVTCYIMAKNMGGDHVLSSSIVMLSTALSVITLTAFLYIMKTAGAI